MSLASTDVLGLLSVILTGLTLVAQSFTVGGIGFLILLVRPLPKRFAEQDRQINERTCDLLRWSALMLALTGAMTVGLEADALFQTLNLRIAEIWGADAIVAGIILASSALLTAMLARGPPDHRRLAGLTVLAVVILSSQTAMSHAASRLTGRTPLVIAMFLHQAGAALWIGGIPYFLFALSRSRGAARLWISKRFSAIALSSLSVLVGASLIMSITYIDSAGAIYGTAYGIMLATKAALLGFLLYLGGMNYLLVRRLRDHPGASIKRMRRFAEAEIGIGITVLFAAASLTSLPPASDTTQDRATLSEIVARMSPRWPRLESPDRMSLAIPGMRGRLEASQGTTSASDVPPIPPIDTGELPPRNAEDIAWSEYNHHWSGVLVLTVGMLAVLERLPTSPAWLRKGARHWPLLFLLLALFLFLRSDPETWPLGDTGFWESLHDPEVLQHRAFVVLIIGFAIFEWSVRTGRIVAPAAALIFPVATAVGAALLLTHSHALANVKELLLIEMTHVPLALLGVLAAWSRWLELRLPRDNRIPSLVWPICFVVIGLLLLDYREA
jgi:putative copper resistance protein D